MASDPKLVQAVFLAAVDLSASDRAATLDRECGTNPELRRRVEALLNAHDRPGSFLESPALGAGLTGDEPPADRPGTIIGPYTLLQQIGEGGMGTVFMAEQTEPVKRKVALKIINPGMDSRQIVARFEAERQALAMMDHPNIAKVLDAGTTSGVRDQESGVRSQQSRVSNQDSAAPSLTPDPCPLLRVVPTSSWSWSKACPSPSFATTTI